MKVFLVAIFSMFAAVVVLTQAFPDLWSEVEEARTADVTESSKSCSTGAGVTECSFSLLQENAYNNTHGLTITETSPGSADRSASASIAMERKQVTVAGLTPSTSYVFDVEFKGVNPALSDDANNLLERFALVVVGGIVLVGSALMLRVFGSA